MRCTVAVKTSKWLMHLGPVHYASSTDQVNTQAVPCLYGNLLKTNMYLLRKWGDSEACLQGNRLFKLAKGLQHCVFQAWQQCSLSLLHGSGEKPMTAVSPLGMPVGNAMGIAGTLGRNAGLPPRPGTAAVPSVSSILGGL
jgi:hypothetical protein